jgi:hypothetical protein
MQECPGVVAADKASRNDLERTTAVSREGFDPESTIPVLCTVLSIGAPSHVLDRTYRMAIPPAIYNLRVGLIVRICRRQVRSAPDSGAQADMSGGPSRANSGPSSTLDKRRKVRSNTRQEMHRSPLCWNASLLCCELLAQ